MSRWWSVPIIGLYYFALHEYFVYFFIVFTMTQIYLAHIGLQIARGRKRWFIIGYITFFSIGTACWLLDQFACEYVQEYQMACILAHVYIYGYRKWITGIYINSEKLQKN